jgi:hypothetical protein
MGTGLGNYTISYVDGKLTVKPASLTVTAKDATKIFGQTLTFTGTEFTASGLLNGDTVTSVSLTSPGAAATATAAGSPYPITPSAAVGTGLGNYTITYVNGSLTVMPEVPPSVGAITAPISPQALGTTSAASASFSDLGVQKTHTASWKWGDGTTSAGIVAENNGSGTVTGGHVYGTDGVFTITLTVTDNFGGSGTSTFPDLVIYNPNGGFVTGGGWINSPPTGKATFGFNAKYKPNSTDPTGNTEFQLSAGNLNFHSTSYDWLVITGAQAQYQGSGTINGAGNFGFTVTGLDGKQAGGVDKFRIKIWDKNSGNNVVYDTQPGAPDTAAPTTALGGGNITVHLNGGSGPQPKRMPNGAGHKEPFTPQLLPGLSAAGPVGTATPSATSTPQMEAETSVRTVPWTAPEETVAKQQPLLIAAVLRHEKSDNTTGCWMNDLAHAIADQLARELVHWRSS